MPKVRKVLGSLVAAGVMTAATLAIAPPASAAVDGCPDKYPRGNIFISGGPGGGAVAENIVLVGFGTGVCNYRGDVIAYIPGQPPRKSGIYTIDCRRPVVFGTVNPQICVGVPPA